MSDLTFSIDLSASKENLLKLLTDYTIASTCSFYPAHHITTGEGGMVSSNNGDIVTTARSSAWWGRDCYCVGSANLLACGTCGNRFDKWLKDYDEINRILDRKVLCTNAPTFLLPRKQKLESNI